LLPKIVTATKMLAQKHSTTAT